MRQVWITRKGAPDVLVVKEAPDPTPGPGQVRVRVAAAGVNFADILARMGLYPDAPKLPCVIGYEVGGTVDAIGTGVKSLKAGDRVLALTRFGGYSDVIVVPELQAVPIPPALTLEKATALPVNYVTAWIMLVKLGNLTKGERILIHAAAGGVGQAALQLARWRGAEVFGTASAGKHQRLAQLGVAHCIDYHTQDFEDEIRRRTDGKGVHLIIDAVGGASFRKSYRSLAPLGRLFLFGVSSLAPGRTRNLFAAVRGLLAMGAFKPLPLMNDNRGVFGVNMGHLWDHAGMLRAILEEILTLVTSGVLEPLVDKTFSFDQAADAHGYLQARKNFGKVLLTP
ncbi:MAG TPA: zinc-binding dehydrogenase [Polyangia bacterium]|jgi:NADPH:quinone reductase-like Zn-dependent oxidoreductase|nr:zinc-binding dehydrogenase [Polyangia bacterium]